MLNNLIPGLAYSGLAGSANNAINSAHTPGGDYDSASMWSGLGGFGLGGAAGALGGYGLSKSLGKSFAKEGAASSLGKLGKSKGTLKALIAANPKMAMLGGGALGALMGSKLMTNAVAGPRDMLEAQQQQYYAQKDASDQMNNMQQAYGNQQVRW